MALTAHKRPIEFPKEESSLDKDYYPTPKGLVGKMWYCIPRKFREQAGLYILEPSAGEGHIIDALNDIGSDYRWRSEVTIHAIEKDQTRAATLRGKGISVIDYDFMTFAGPDKYDIIMMNPPFSVGEHHLLKAIEILYSGHIVCLLNAETIKRPFSNFRKMLVKRLKELNADIEYLTLAFKEAERKTKVEVALVHICIEREIEKDIFEGIESAEKMKSRAVEADTKELAERESIEGLVAAYNRAVEISTQTLLDYYKNYPYVSNYIKVLVGDEQPERYTSHDKKSLTSRMQMSLNKLVASIRKSYWHRALELKAVRSKMTRKRLNEFEQHMKQNELMDFTAANIRQFIINLAGNYETILTEAVLEIFDNMTRKYAWDKDLHNDNVHYFNGWKTNDAYRLNKRVILPVYGSCGEAFTDYGKWRLNWQVRQELDDIDKVMNYFDGRGEYVSMSAAIERAFSADKNRGIVSTYFKFSCFKKGTIHLEFLSDDIRRRFNVTACKGKEWLFHDYGCKKYDDLTEVEQTVVDTFEDKKTYEKNVTDQPSLYVKKDLVQLEHLKST